MPDGGRERRALAGQGGLGRARLAVVQRLPGLPGRPAGLPGPRGLFRASPAAPHPRGGRGGALAAQRGDPRGAAVPGRLPRRLPRGLDRAETAALLGSFRTGRDRAIAGLMLLSGLRSAEVLGLRVADIDIGRGWVRVTGKGDKERRVPVDPDVAGLIQSYLLAERPETSSPALFVVAKGPHRGQPLTAAGLRRVFRSHREIPRGAPGAPHPLRPTLGTPLPAAGGDLPRLPALIGDAT